MIRLYLGTEPAALTASRAVNLPLAITAINHHGVNAKAFTKVLGEGYQVARPYLYKLQHKKCAFCEIVVDDINSPVEHFRPKGGAKDKRGTRWYKAATHYWWMTWTWENLFFSCNRCNFSGSKGNKFPLRQGAQRMLAPATPCPAVIPQLHYDHSGESSLLINPRLDNPLDHLQWALVDPAAHPRNWRWTVVGQDDKGDMTIEVFNLAHRIDMVNNHLKVVKEAREHIENYLAINDLRNARATWDRAVLNYVCDPEQPFRNAVWWALNDIYPKHEQIRHGFAHPPTPVC